MEKPAVTWPTAAGAEDLSCSVGKSALFVEWPALVLPKTFG